MKKPTSSYVSNIEINGLRGRMLNLPAPENTNKNILLIYGHHASLERMFGIAENLNDYGSVIAPDLPGFGGMSSFHAIGYKPTIENFADYLATFIKLKFKNKKFVIVSMSFSFLIVTKMLQKYPEIADQVETLVSSVGFVHHEDFSLSKPKQFGIVALGTIFQSRPMAFIAGKTIFSEFAVKSFYNHFGHLHTKMNDTEDKKIREKRIKAEVILWRINDIRTRMKTMKDMFSVDLLDKKVDIPVHHVFVDGDRFFDNRVVEQHMKIIYKDFKGIQTNINGHMPSIVANKKEADVFIPDGLKKLLK